jgi:NAD(P)H-dependent FMN reductase
VQNNILHNINDISTSILDLSLYPFLLELYGVDSANADLLAKNKEEVLEQLYACDAIVFIVPEWGGMIPPALVNLLLLTANGSANGLPLGHKPGFIIGISASSGGSYPISLLKGYAAKNSHITWLPLHAIIQNVEAFLEMSWQPTLDNRFSQVQSRLQVGLKSLVIYSNQLANVREELVVLSKVHPFGQ